MSVNYDSRQVPDGAGKPSADQLRAEIADTRAELGETLQALAARADVRARARESAAEAAQRMREAWLTPTPWLVVTAGLATTTLLVVVARWRSSGGRHPHGWHPPRRRKRQGFAWRARQAYRSRR